MIRKKRLRTRLHTSAHNLYFDFLIYCLCANGFLRTGMDRSKLTLLLQNICGIDQSDSLNFYLFLLNFSLFERTLRVDCRFPIITALNFFCEGGFLSSQVLVVYRVLNIFRLPPNKHDTFLRFSPPNSAFSTLIQRVFNV